MTYADIQDRVLSNVGRTKDGTFVETVKKDIFDVITKIYRKTEPIKKENTTEITITTTSQETTVPDDFFVPNEVLFFDADGLRFPSKELQYEEYMRWNPEVDAVTTSFNELITPAVPAGILYTQENADLDGIVGFTFSDTKPQKLLWKPAVGGTIKLYYSAIAPEIADQADSPEISVMFHDLTVIGVTIRQLIRKLKDTSDQIKLIGLQTEIRHYKEEWNETLSNFYGFTNRNTSTPKIEPFDFLNDSSMLLLDGR